MTTTLRFSAFCALFAPIFCSHLFAQDFESWLVQQQEIAKADLLANIEPPDSVEGIVIASPSRNNDEPNYYFDWVRDGAITMMAIVKLYEHEQDTIAKDERLNLILRYARNARKRQSTENRSGQGDARGLGEPKWHVDNSPFVDDWGRPQNDGPALRARTLIYFAEVLLREGNHELVKELYNRAMPADSVIKVDLEFIARHWQEPSYELWEEVKGLHFSTLVQQRRALLTGAFLADQCKDSDAAVRYRLQAAAIANELRKFWNSDRQHFVQTHKRVDGLDYKESNIDASIIIALLDQDEHPFVAISDQRVLKTAELLRAEMHKHFAINQIYEFDHDGKRMGDAIGRYIEDRYDGVSVFSSGNPWFLITAAFAEFNYAAALQFVHAEHITVSAYNAGFLQHALGNIKVTLELGEVIGHKDQRFATIMNALLESGDSYLRRWRFHAATDGSTSEQFNRHTGFMQGAKKLTWNCAAFLSALGERAKLKAHLEQISH